MARKRTPKQVASLPRADHLQEKILNLEEFLGTSDAKRNGAAYVAGTRLSASLKAELDALLNPISVQSDPTKGMTDAEITNALATALRALPLALLDDVLDAVGAERVPNAQPALTVVTGGQ